MIILQILLGLVGLGILVIVHELGHFLAARLVGINVEAFSIGWGNPIFKKKIGTVEYRIGMFPIGGYCKMQGETDYNLVYENIQNNIQPQKGSYLAATPAARIIVSFGGPFFNLVFAVILLSFLWGFGFEINTFGNKVVLASEIMNDESFPADIAGIKTGDRVIEINGQPISYFHEIQENIALNPDRTLPVIVERDGRLLQLNVTPSLDRSSGAGRIGIYFWADPVIGFVMDGSPAQNAGLQPGDILVSANGIAINNSTDLMKIRREISGELTLEFERNGILREAVFSAQDMEGELGFSWETIRYRTPNLSILAAIAKGIQESYRTLTVSISSLRLLFMGIDLTQAVSGPARITYMIGDMATQGFGQGVGTGLRTIANFLALISIVLCVMNLLPLPIIDGGMIVLFLVEMIRGKPAHPKAIAVFQTCGMIIISCLIILALFGDILFFAAGAGR